jgi:hypothetical protein
VPSPLLFVGFSSFHSAPSKEALSFARKSLRPGGFQSATGQSDAISGVWGLITPAMMVLCCLHVSCCTRDMLERDGKGLGSFFAGHPRFPADKLETVVDIQALCFWSWLYFPVIISLSSRGHMLVLTVTEN